MQRLTLLLVAVVAFAACDFVSTVEVANDGSGTVVVDVSIDPRLGGEVCVVGYNQGVPAEPECEESEVELTIVDDLPAGAELVSYETGPTDARAEIAFDRPETLARILLTGSNDADTPSEFSLAQDGTRWHLEGKWMPAPDREILAELSRAGFDEPSVVFRIDPPGGVIEHNANQRRGAQLIWQWNLTEPKTLQALSDTTRDDPPQLPQGPVAVAVAAILATMTASAIAALRVAGRNGADGVAS